MNISPSFAVKSIAALATLSLVGCGPSDGLQELAEGRFAYEQGDYKKAEKMLLKSADCNAENIDTLVSLAQLRLRNGELAGAKEWIAKAEAIGAAETDVRLLGAQIAWHAKDYAKAEKLFDGIAHDTSLDPVIRAQGWTGLGIVQATCSEYDLARVSYLRAIRLNSRSADARYHLGHLYRYAPYGYPEAAREQFEAFVHLDGADEASPRVQKTQRTIIPGLTETINRAATERPGVAQRNSAACTAALSKASAAQKRNDVKGAATAYQEALTADPLSYPAALGLARMQCKLDASAAGQQKALKTYATACSLRPSVCATLVEAGQLAERIKSHAQAREFFSRAVAANPANVSALDGLIRSLKKANAEAKVINAYQAYRDSLPAAKK